MTCTTQILVVLLIDWKKIPSQHNQSEALPRSGSERHQDGLSALVTQMSFCEGSTGDLPKRRLLSQAKSHFYPETARHEVTAMHLWTRCAWLYISFEDVWDWTFCDYPWFSVQMSCKPASSNRLPIIDRRLKIVWKVPSLRRSSA